MAGTLTQAHAGHNSLLLEDPELAQSLTEPRLTQARRECLARIIHVRAGPWTPVAREADTASGIGVLVLDGLLARRVGLDGRFGAEILGPGDLLRPWQREDAEPTLPHTGGWRVLQASRLAVLDSAFSVRAAPYHELTAALVGRAIRRSRHLAVNMAIVTQPRVDARLHMLFWELADRWGTVHGDGVHLRARLTHAILGELIAARRPSVTKALKELSERDTLRWTGSDWLVKGQAPGELREIRGTAPARIRERRPAARPRRCAIRCVSGDVSAIRALSARLRPSRPRSCPVCHASLLPDDAVGVFGGMPVHAECALFEWLGSRERMRDALADV